MAAGGTNIGIHAGGAWRYPYQIGVHAGGSFRDVKDVWVYSGGAWRQSWVKSDPQTYQWTATWGQTFAQGGGQVDEAAMGILDQDLLQGYWNEAGLGLVSALIGFDDVDIRAKLAVRPTINAVKLKLDNFLNWDTGDGGTKAVIGVHAQADRPASWTHSHTDCGYVVTGYQMPGSVWHDLSSAIGGYFRDGIAKGILLHDCTDNTTTAGKSLYRGGWRGPVGVVPILEITCDYA